MSPVRGPADRADGHPLGRPKVTGYKGFVDPEAMLETERLVLEPLLPAHADEMFPILNDARLHEFTGGTPATLAELRVRYGLLNGRRSPDGKEGWLNWVIRARETAAAVGSVQATIVGNEASVAWVIGAEWQGRGFATEAATALVSHLLADPTIFSVRALIADGHVASERVAERAGLQVTGELKDGERVWRREVCA